MTREEAIKIFQLMKKILSIPNSDAARTIEAIDMAIEALQNEETLKTQLANCHREILRLLDFNNITESPNDVVEPQNDVVEVVRCKDCMHRHEYECPMYHEEWFTIDEGDGYVDDDYNVIDKTVDDGFCQYGERREE